MRLLVVYPRAFTSGWGAETPRLMQMARGLNQFGWTVELLRCRLPHDDQLQPVVKAFPGKVTTAPFFGPFSSFTNRKGLRRALRVWWSLRRYVERDDYPELIAGRLVEFCATKKISRPDVVLGFTGGQLESFVSAHSLSVHFGCPLVMEFRDPIPHPGNPPLDPGQQELLNRCLSHASLVIGTTKGLCKWAAQQFGVSASKLRTIYSSYDDEVPVPVSPNVSTDRLVLVHAGVLYGGSGRNARSLVQALARAVEGEDALRNRVQLRLIGAGKGGAEAMELARELNISWAVELVPQMAHRACLDELDKANLLVVIKFDDANFDQQVPGKLFQYLGRRKPILGIMRETEAADILRRSGLGLVFDHSDIGGMAGALIDLWKNRGSLQTRFIADRAYIGQFTLGEMARNFHRELSVLIPGRSASANGHDIAAGHPSNRIIPVSRVCS